MEHLLMTDGPRLSIKQRIGRFIFPRLPVTRFLFNILRFEVAAGLVRLENRVMPSRRRRLRSVRAQRDVLVNVACGPQILPGFLNIDLYPAAPDVLVWDSRRRLPLGDAAAAGIRVEQFVEHLEPREELPSFLKDCHRTLRRGGVLRIIVPDAGRYLQAYCRPDRSGFDELAVPNPFPDDLPTRMDVINHVFHQWDEHRWAYDFETLAHRLRSAGFEAIEQAAYRRSRLGPLAEDREVHAPYSLYVEAIKGESSA
jgi:predicted SAM-dependent methyltransferase